MESEEFLIQMIEALDIDMDDYR